MTVMTRPVLPGYLDTRQDGESAGAYLVRVAERYAASRPAALGRLAWIEQIDNAALVSDLGGQDPYPRYGADQNDFDTEAPDE